MFERKKTKAIRVSTIHYKGPERRTGKADRRLGGDRRKQGERRKKRERILVKKDLGETISQTFWKEMQILRTYPNQKYSLPWKSKIKGYVIFRNGKFYIFTERRFPEERRSGKARRSNERKTTEVIKRGK